MMLNVPLRMHSGMCFNLLSTRFESPCSGRKEDNCYTGQGSGFNSTPPVGYRTAYSQIFNWEDDYDSGFALALHNFMQAESQRLGRGVSLTHLASAAGTYVSSLRQLHEKVSGIDGRLDAVSALEADGIWHNVSQPMPRILRQSSDWVLALRVVPSIRPSDMLFHLLDLNCEGFIVHWPREYYLSSDNLGELQVVSSMLGYERDVMSEQNLRMHSGLLCCRGIFNDLIVFRKLAPPCNNPPDVKTDWRKSQLFTKGATTVVVDNDGVDEDWLDFKVPSFGVIWGSAKRQLSMAEQWVTMIYLKLFRLAIVSDEQLSLDVETMQLEWEFVRSNLLDRFIVACPWRGSDLELQDEEFVSPGWCDLVRGSCELLERAAARLACTGGCAADLHNHFDAECDYSKGSPGEQIVAAAAAGLRHEFKSVLTEQFRDLHVLAEYARCSWSADWPPARFTYSPDYSSVSMLTFQKTLWGKYMFRIHGSAGVRS